MSYIFDALKKLEYDRHRSKESNNSVSQGALMSNTKTRKIWPYILAGSFVLNAVILLIWLQPWRADKAIQPVQSTVQPKQEMPPQPISKESTEIKKEAVSVQPEPVKAVKPEPEVVRHSTPIKAKESVAAKPVIKDIKSKNTVKLNTVKTKRNAEDSYAGDSSATKSDIFDQKDAEEASGTGVIKVWIDEQGNKHFSGSVGGR